MSPTLRSRLFWLMDSLKGGNIRKHYEDIKFINENDDHLTSDSRRKEHIHNLLKHATQTTPYYQEYKELDNIESFPVIKKTLIQDNFEKFRSKTYLNKQSYKVATSGSTGVPFTLYQDINKKHRNSADTIYFLNKANYSIGEKLYDIEVWRNINMKSSLKAWMQNLVYIDVSRFNDQAIELFLERLAGNSSPVNLLGFASAFESICLYLDKYGSDKLAQIKANSITANSEYLSSYVKDSMEKYFNVPVVSRYSNEELGLMAQQIPIPEKDDFFINWASYHIEILKMNKDIPAAPGEMGRIVVTDLFNYCMPIIRYDTGDISMFSDPSLNSLQRTLKRVEGRKMDIVYDTRGEIISSFVIYTKFYPYYHLIRQYQFIQIGAKEYLVKLNTHTGKFKFSNNLIDSIKDDFGLDASITLQLVDEIPPLSSGKRKKVVNSYNPPEAST